MSPELRRVPELLLEQLSLGEISAADERWLRAELGEEELSRRLATLREGDAAHQRERSVERILPALESRRRVAVVRDEQARARRQAVRWLVPSAAVMALALFMVARPAGDTDSHGVLVDGPDTTRVKGIAAHLVVHRRVGAESETLADSARVRAGDVLQVGYVAAGARHGVILSVDGARAVTLHFPEHEGASTALVADAEQLLAHAYELDTAPHFERFFFVTSDAPIDISAVMQAARELSSRPDEGLHGTLDHLSELEQSSLTLVKE
jgi:hypothetical protein